MQSEVPPSHLSDAASMQKGLGLALLKADTAWVHRLWTIPLPCSQHVDHTEAAQSSVLAPRTKILVLRISSLASVSPTPTQTTSYPSTGGRATMRAKERMKAHFSFLCTHLPSEEPPFPEVLKRIPCLVLQKSLSPFHC